MKRERSARDGPPISQQADTARLSEEDVAMVVRAVLRIIALGEYDLRGPVQPIDTLLRMKDVIKHVGLGKSMIHLFTGENPQFADPDFPRPVPLTKNGNAVGYSEHQLGTWIEGRKSLSKRLGGSIDAKKKVSLRINLH